MLYVRCGIVEGGEGNIRESFDSYSGMGEGHPVDDDGIEVEGVVILCE